MHPEHICAKFLDNEPTDRRVEIKAEANSAANAYPITI